MSTLKVDAIRHNSATSDAITTASDGTCTARITGMTGGGGLSHRNIIINGDFKVNQRGQTSSTISGYGTVDRFETTIDTGDSNLMTQSHNTLSSSDTPYSFGFRKSFKLTNHSSGQSADAADYAALRHIIEASDIANSGWNYTSSSSNITLSFWVKASVSQNYLLQVRSYDGTAKRISFLVNLTAGQWTKVTKTIPGDSGITVNNDNGGGLHILWLVYYGSNYVSGSTTDVWQSGTPSPVFPTTWYTTASSTFEITGVQLEVGDTATSFEFRNFGDELLRCQRYYYKLGRLDYISQHMSASEIYGIGMSDNDNTNIYAMINFPVSMRVPPTAIEQTGSAGDYRVRRDTTQTCSSAPQFIDAANHYCRVNFIKSGHGWGTGQMLWCMSGGSSSYLGFDAELKYNS
jgi:hypothetical protein